MKTKWCMHYCTFCPFISSNDLMISLTISVSACWNFQIRPQYGMKELFLKVHSATGCQNHASHNGKHSLIWFNDKIYYAVYVYIQSCALNISYKSWDTGSSFVSNDLRQRFELKLLLFHTQKHLFLKHFTKNPIEIDLGSLTSGLQCFYINPLGLKVVSWIYFYECY